MELENDLKKLRFAAPTSYLRARILRDAQQPVRAAIVPHWLAAIESHWLYPGRAPAAALAIAWLIIASLRFSTPPAAFPSPTSTVRIGPNDFVRLEVESSRILAELQADESHSTSQPAVILTPRS